MVGDYKQDVEALMKLRETTQTSALNRTGDYTSDNAIASATKAIAQLVEAKALRLLKRLEEGKDIQERGDDIPF